MNYRILNASAWTFDQLAPYGAAITAAMKQLAEKFPEDVSVAQLAHECLIGARQLWLILDDDGAFVSFCCTSVKTIDGTGVKLVTLTSHAGAEGLDCCAEMCRVIEAWAAEQGADYTAAEGRRGWGRELSKQGYRQAGCARQAGRATAGSAPSSRTGQPAVEWGRATTCEHGMGA